MARHGHAPRSSSASPIVAMVIQLSAWGHPFETCGLSDLENIAYMELE